MRGAGRISGDLKGMRMLQHWKRIGAIGLVISVPVIAQIPTGVTVEVIYDPAKVTFNQPTGIAAVPDDGGQFVVVERPGKIFRLVRNGTLYEKKAWFSVDANVVTHWDGAWSVEFHPRFRENRLFYVLYRLKGTDDRSVIEEWTSDADLGNPRKVRNIIFFNQKEIHSSGDIHFGPDGYLYSAQGDRDQKANGGQLMSEMWGKMIRIDVNRKDQGLEYAIPDNPFKGQAGVRPEIWASGFRVPYRFSFDKLNGDIYLGDVGDVTNEEVNLVQAGKNYGAGKVEGACKTGCAGLTDPIAALPHGCVIGGVVYRNDPTSKFYGAYIYADYQNSKVYALKLNDAKTGVSENKQIVATAPGRISTMGQDAAGNIYIAVYLENPSTSQTHIYRLKHAELRPAAVAIRPSAGDGSLLQRSGMPASTGHGAYSLEGKRLSGTSAPGSDVVIFRDGKTGKVSKSIRLRY